MKVVKKKTIPGFMNNQALRVIFFGGKGGVGKTTFACAAGVYLAGNRPDKKVLIISVDPSHSLSDSFKLSIGDKITPVQWSASGPVSDSVESTTRREGPTPSPSCRALGAGSRRVVKGKVEDSVSSIQHPTSSIQYPVSTNLFALELDVRRLSDDFKGKYLPIIESIAFNGTYLDQQDVSALFSLSIPGLDEIAAILEIAGLYRSRHYDIMIIDTAASGHTFRFLRCHSQMRRWLRLFQLMKLKHRYISTHLTGSYVRDDTDRFLETMDKDMEDVRVFFKNIKSTQFIPVLTPEAMSIKETERLIAVLDEEKIPVRDLIISQISDEKEGRIPLDQIHKKFKRYNIIKAPLFPDDIRGLGGLKRMAQVLTLGYQSLQSMMSKEGYPAPCGMVSLDTRMNQDPLEIFDNPRRQFIIFGGKAGSGKTSLASATAIHLADRYPDKKIMLFSIDPAHSLADAFDLPIGNKETLIPGFHNLYATEVDGARIWDERKTGYKNDITRAFGRYRDNPQGSLDVVSSEVKFDREIMTEFVEATPPHADETMAVQKLMGFVLNEKYDLYILDTGPVVQQLCLLELPTITLAWIKAVINMLYKYRKFIRFDEPISKLLLLRRDMRKMGDILVNESMTEFVTVTTPSILSFLEIERLLLRIGQSRIPNHHIIRNKIVPLMNDNLNHLKGLENQGHRISHVPLFPYEITGLHNLKRFSQVLYACPVTTSCNRAREPMEVNF